MFEIPSRYRHKFYTNALTDDGYGVKNTLKVVSSPDEAEVVSSEIEGGLHAPVLDIDFAATLVPSSTPGHYHLYLDMPMTWRKYKALLKALAAAGIIEQGYMRASLRRGHSAVRVPGLKKANSPLPGY